MLGWSRMLREHRIEEPEKVDHALSVIERNAKAQTQLVEDLLDVSRIVNGKLRLDFQPIHLAAIIESAVDGVRPAAANKNITLELQLNDRTAVVSGDPDRLGQVVWNLLSNAVKFTPDGGRVLIDLRRSDRYAEVTVSDTGQGIEPEFLPHVFERFRQAHGGLARRHGGLGLGLALVRALVEAHGGTAHAASAGPDKGATFSIRLPLQSPRGVGEERQRRVDECPDLTGIRVLIVEDDGDARELIAMIIKECGAIPMTAASVREALRLLHEGPPDVVLADLGMPEQDGYEFIRILRNLPNGVGRLPAIAVTAYASGNERAEAVRAGYDAHVPKPVDRDLLIQAIGRVIDSRKEQPD
jgi:CheY-like chemotaxis protein/two-component sensor histidine kinase